MANWQSCSTGCFHVGHLAVVRVHQIKLPSDSPIGPRVHAYTPPRVDVLRLQTSLLLSKVSGTVQSTLILPTASSKEVQPVMHGDD